MVDTPVDSYNAILSVSHRRKFMKRAIGTVLDHVSKFDSSFLLTTNVAHFAEEN